MITAEKIKRGGSKLEITREILESGLDIPVPVSAWRYYGNDLAPLESAFQKMKKPVIVRGSHQNDYHGFIDVVPTIREVNTLPELGKAVKIIESGVQSQDVQIHCGDWQQPFTPEVHILMQEQSPSPLNGSMLRHPHKQAGYYLQYRDITDNGPSRYPCSYIVQGIVYDDYFHFFSWLELPNEKKMAKQGIEMFKKLEACGVLEKDLAYQVEFGLDPLLFFQARPFKRLQSAQDFKIPMDLNQLAITSSDVFGITSEEGVELDCLIYDEQNLRTRGWGRDFNKERAQIKGGFGLIQIQKFQHLYSSPINLKLGDLSFYRSPCQAYDFLFHENYRFMKKADISFADTFVTGQGDRSSSYYQFGDFKKVRVISNGNKGIAIPIK